MKRIVIFSVFALLLGSCAQTPIYLCQWQDKAFIVDGKANDWNGKLTAESRYGCLYGVSSDHNNLYVMLKILDTDFQQKVLMTGLNFWINTTGKARKQLGITYPFPGFLSELRNPGSAKGQERWDNLQQLTRQSELQSLNKYLSSEKTKIKLTGFKDRANSDSDVNQSSNPVFAMMQFDSSGALIYESRIPIRYIFKDPVNFIKNLQRHFSYGFTAGPDEDLSSPPFGGSGFPGEGRESAGMRPEGPPPGGGIGAGPPDMPDFQKMSQPVKLWVKKARFLYQ
ncbi:MAG: hypothetical protein NT175_01345 [Bacteroidetes bacterium]|nr:hypothetical protein [Bacteroidota bacterium]